jgi:hypothetical protein
VRAQILCALRARICSHTLKNRAFLYHVIKQIFPLCWKRKNLLWAWLSVRHKGLSENWYLQNGWWSKFDLLNSNVLSHLPSSRSRRLRWGDWIVRQIYFVWPKIEEATTRSCGCSSIVLVPEALLGGPKCCAKGDRFCQCQGRVHNFTTFTTYLRHLGPLLFHTGLGYASERHEKIFVPVLDTGKNGHLYDYL